MGASTLSDPLESASLNHWLAVCKRPNRVGALIILPEGGNRPQFPKHCVLETLDDGQSPKT
jgi:hypothetical protein